MHICPLEWRYGSSDMRNIFAISNIVRTYIEVEIALMAGLARAGIAPTHCVEALRKCSDGLEPGEIYRLEEAIGHDIASLAYILGERCGECGRYVHLGATSYDIVDTSWAILIGRALEIVKSKLRRILEAISKLAIEHRDTIMVGRTHGQHALPITLGFKLANYVFELSRSYERICQAGERIIRSKFSGAVGTMAAWGDKGFEVEKGASEYLGIEPHVISTQVAPRDGFAELISILAILASQLDRFALEVRELSRTEIGELYESEERVGSSTMPHKRNPTVSERISGLAKILRSLVIASLENIPLMHERDLTNSSSERILIPHAFLIIDQMLEDTLRLLKILRIDVKKMMENIGLTRGAIMSESIMVKLVEKGIPRHIAHKMLLEVTRDLGDRSLTEALTANPNISQYLSKEEIEEALDPRRYLGKYGELIERAIKYMEKTVEKCR
ncbi:MAG: adenylosuccinate lyase [Sulfolobales archaeon]